MTDAKKYTFDIIQSQMLNKKTIVETKSVNANSYNEASSMIQKYISNNYFGTNGPPSESIYYFHKLKKEKKWQEILRFWMKFGQ